MTVSWTASARGRALPTPARGQRDLGSSQGFRSVVRLQTPKRGSGWRVMAEMTHRHDVLGCHRGSDTCQRSRRGRLHRRRGQQILRAVRVGTVLGHQHTGGDTHRDTRLDTRGGETRTGTHVSAHGRGHALGHASRHTGGDTRWDVPLRFGPSSRQAPEHHSSQPASVFRSRVPPASL